MNRVEDRTPLMLAVISIMASVLLFIFIKPIAQDSEYHHFADAKSVLGIAFFWNVISNLGFVLAGLYGYIILSKYKIHSLLILTLN